MTIEVSPQLRKCFALAREAGLSRADRIDLAHYLTGRDQIRSWSDLSVEETVRVLDALNGWFAVNFLRGEQKSIDATVVVSDDRIVEEGAC